MPYVHPSHPLRLREQTIGNGECAAIAQDDENGVPGLIPRLIPGSHPERYYPRVDDWTPGLKVKGANLVPGTVIAIFDSHGKYLGQKGYDYSGGKAHTALYVRQSSEGIEVVHQFHNHPVCGTLIRFGGERLTAFSTRDFNVRVSDSTVPSLRFAEQGIPAHLSGVSRLNTTRGIVTPEDNADNYYVVELKPPPGSQQIPNKTLNSDFEVQVTNSTARSK
jgi:hypothetical protein